MAEGTFVTAVNCMDGRVQEPVIRWMKNRFGADYVDMITEPGPDGILAGGRGGLIGSIRRRVDVSIGRHGSEAVAVVAHHDCAGNPVSKAEHLAQLERAVQVVGAWGLPVRVVGLWVNEHWQVELAYDLEPRSRERSGPATRPPRARGSRGKRGAGLGGTRPGKARSW